ncbi:transmembrane protein, putative [Medicago truncatula]|uniref:Transmembrane protein, putative n=1 Tax=Medicago truncatula TaxID=3880 RepID=G7KKT6_MEDTR|nr:transmembrane protein, putative [Medicago truncatula]
MKKYGVANLYLAPKDVFQDSYVMWEGNESEFIGNIVEHVFRMFDGAPPLHTAISDVVPEVSQTSANVHEVASVVMSISFHRMFKVLQAKTTWRVLGLLSYALGPSFNRLFGSHQFPLSTRYVQLKTCTLFAVLMIISVYSFFYDRALNGKPDILSVVSNAAFSMVSLSLHKLTNFGFEIGGFSYFLGCFTIQLLTINWILIFVAIIYGCLLFVIRSSLNSQPEVASEGHAIPP